MRNSRFVGLSVLLAAALAPTQQASGAVLYAAQWARGVYAIDVDAQTVTEVLAIGDVWAIASSDDPDMLYITSHSSDMRTLSISTGSTASLLGSISTNSLGYGYDGMLYSGQFNSPDLTVYDPSTGVATIAGSGSVSGYAGDLVAAPDGDLFGLSRDNEIVRISKADGSTTVISTVDPSVQGWGIATTYDGRYWLTSGSELYMLNVRTGATTFVMDMGVTAYDLASAPGETFQTMEIPTPGSMAIFAMAGGVVLWRKR